MKLQDRILLRLFNGDRVALADIEAHEDYWVLIGERGVILDDNTSGTFAIRDGFPRVLVQFDTSLDNLGLENHNPIKNSLWIRSSDLKLVT
ncbi:hypothetical protein [Litoreibacter halocynthiae]|uniref:hypothetical protein n=1 Tax=Litoreibacter halocynthiae TaxID=1242689 RepID=UPI00249118D2|nr:hypothetical protein [Litoreibacter halocynthiae]